LGAVDQQVSKHAAACAEVDAVKAEKKSEQEKIEEVKQ